METKEPKINALPSTNTDNNIHPVLNKNLKEAVLNIENIILNMKIIGSIQKGDKLLGNDIDNEVLEIESNDFLQPIRRWWFSRNRLETINKIKIIVNKSFDITDRTLENERDASYNKDIEYFSEENSSLLQRFLVEMKQSTKGLENLKITYDEDVKIISEIDILIEKLQLRIQKIQNGLKIDKTIFK